MRAGIILATVLALLSQRAMAQDTYVVAPKTLADEKAVFATVESTNVVPARARIGGTVADLAVKEGDRVKQGQVIATVGDEKLALQMKSLDAQIAGLEAQLAQSQTDLTAQRRLVLARHHSPNPARRKPHRLQCRIQCAEGAHRRTLGDAAAGDRGQRFGADHRPRVEGAGDGRHGDPAGRSHCHRRRTEFRVADAGAGAARPLS